MRDALGNEIGVFTGKSPRQAALKAANRGYIGIRLREAGHEEGACIHRREGAGGQAQRSTGLDGGQDLEAQGQEGRNGEAGGALKLFW